jgi:hypothetical protein
LTALTTLDRIADERPRAWIFKCPYFLHQHALVAQACDPGGWALDKRVTLNIPRGAAAVRFDVVVDLPLLLGELHSFEN